MVVISNLAPRRDVESRLMDVHDGNIARLDDGRYWWWGIGYRNCTRESSWMAPQYCPGIWGAFGSCGFRDDHALNVYSSPDLAHWTFEGDALPKDSGRPNGIYFRPKVVYDSASASYILWINYLASPPAGARWPRNTPLAAYTKTSIVVAQSTSPRGPFTVLTAAAELQVGAPGDFALHIASASGEAFVAYDAWDNDHRVRVEALRPDWMGTDATRPGVTVSPHENEAPIMFERRGWYYLAFGHVCCFCEEGAGATLKVARHPLGPWLDTGVDLNPPHPDASSDWSGRPIPTQNNHVFVARTASGEDQYIFTADLWRSAPDGLKSHDLQFWSKLTFDDTVTPPAIAPLTWVDDFEIDLEVVDDAPPMLALDSEVALVRQRLAEKQATRIHSSELHPYLTALIGAVALSVSVCVYYLCCGGRNRRMMVA